jgi:hypothetical protein
MDILEDDSRTSGRCDSRPGARPNGASECGWPLQHHIRPRPSIRGRSNQGRARENRRAPCTWGSHTGFRRSRGNELGKPWMSLPTATRLLSLRRAARRRPRLLRPSPRRFRRAARSLRRRVRFPEVHRHRALTERSGNKHWVHWRWACPTFIRQTFVEWSASSIAHSFWARAFYDSHRAKGASHNATVRALAFKWIRILFRCWVDRTPYDESRYLSALQKRQSPLLKFAAAQPS